MKTRGDGIYHVDITAETRMHFTAMLHLQRQIRISRQLLSNTVPMTRKSHTQLLYSGNMSVTYSSNVDLPEVIEWDGKNLCRKGAENCREGW